MTLIHIYARMPKRRALIRTCFAEILSNILLLDHKVYGVNEILTIYSSIVCGFALPIKQDHIQFLKRCILPLHKLVHLQDISTNLFRCVLLFLSKDPSLCVMVGVSHSFLYSFTISLSHSLSHHLTISLLKTHSFLTHPQITRRILHYWSKANSTRNLLLLQEVEMIVNALPDFSLMSSVLSCFLNHLKHSIESQQFRVSLRNY